MFSLLYDFCLFVVGLIALPRFLVARFFFGKYRNSIKERLGFVVPKISKKKQLIWIHAVSFGETRAVIGLYRRLREEFQDATFVITSVTETGHEEAKRSLAHADAYLFLPLDFSWLMKRFVRRLQPDLLLLVEGELWYNLLRVSKKHGAKIALVNGKLSERSHRRFSRVSFFARRVLSLIDYFCVQSGRFEERFLELGVPREKLFVTGNLKLDLPLTPMHDEEKRRFRQELGIEPDDELLVLGSTHAPEEEWLLAAAQPLLAQLPKLKILIVPRHPERFDRLAKQLTSHGFSLLRYSQRDQKRGDERVILIDAMGKLLHCYQIARVAIVGGSFIPKVGGHNIFEPVQVGTPVFFGPYMQAQLDLTELIVRAGAGKQVSLTHLPDQLSTWLRHPKSWDEVHNRCGQLAKETSGATERTWQTLEKLKL